MTSSPPAPQLSTALVAYLREQGKTLRQIGEIVGLSESFVSRVANGERSFTIDHLGLFERQLGEPLPALLLQAVWGRDVAAEQRPAFDEALRLLRELSGFRQSLAAGAVARTRKAAPAKRTVAGSVPKKRRAAG